MSVGIALAVLGEPFSLLLAAGTALVVAGGVTLGRERARPAHFRLLGSSSPSPAPVSSRSATTSSARRPATRTRRTRRRRVSLAAAALVTLAYVVVFRREQLGNRLRVALPAFAPAGVALALAYDSLFAAFDRGRVSIVAPLNATQSCGPCCSRC
jgi:drug/metabolite transporter (DMT)-like permease